MICFRGPGVPAESFAFGGVGSRYGAKKEG